MGQLIVILISGGIVQHPQYTLTILAGIYHICVIASTPQREGAVEVRKTNRDIVRCHAS